MRKDTIGYLRVEASWIRRAILTLFDAASERAQELEDAAHGAWEAITTDAFSNLPERDLQQRAHQLRAYAGRAAALALDLAVESGRLLALVAVREADQPDTAVK